MRSGVKTETGDWTDRWSLISKGLTHHFELSLLRLLGQWRQEEGLKDSRRKTVQPFLINILRAPG